MVAKNIEKRGEKTVYFLPESAVVLWCSPVLVVHLFSYHAQTKMQAKMFPVYEKIEIEEREVLNCTIDGFWSLGKFFRVSISLPIVQKDNAQKKTKTLDAVNIDRSDGRPWIGPSQIANILKIMGNKCLKLQYKFMAEFLKRSYQDISHTKKINVVSSTYEFLLASSFWNHFRNVSRALPRLLQETRNQMRTILNTLLIPNWWIWKMAQFAEHQFLTTHSGKRS